MGISNEPAHCVGGIVSDTNENNAAVDGVNAWLEKVWAAKPGAEFRNLHLPSHQKMAGDDPTCTVAVVRDAGLALLGGDYRFLNALTPDAIGPYILEEVEASVGEMEGIFTTDTSDEAASVVSALGALLCSLAASHCWSMPMDDDRFVQRFQDELTRRCRDNPALEASVVQELRNWAGDRPMPSIDGWADRLRLR